MCSLDQVTSSPGDVMDHDVEPGFKLEVRQQVMGVNAIRAE